MAALDDPADRAIRYGSAFLTRDAPDHEIPDERCPRWRRCG